MLPPQPAVSVSYVFLVELINTATCLSRFLLSCIERMALGADLNVDILLSRTCHKCISTVAGYCSLMILRMDSFAHDIHLSILKLFIIISKQLSNCSIR